MFSNKVCKNLAQNQILFAQILKKKITKIITKIILIKIIILK